MIHSFAIKNQLFIPPQHSFLFGTSIPRGERVNSQIGKQNKKKYPKLPESVLFFTLKAAIIVHCIQPSYARSDAVLLYILTGYVTAWRRETPQTESWSSTVFRNRALAEQRKRGGWTGGESTIVATFKEDRMSKSELIPPSVLLHLSSEDNKESVSQRSGTVTGEQELVAGCCRLQCPGFVTVVVDDCWSCSGWCRGV